MNEDQFQVKHNRFSQTNSHTDALKNKQPINSNTDYQNEDTGKSITKLPPLKKAKPQEISQTKMSDLYPPPQLERKNTQPDRKNMTQTQNTYVVRKFNSKRKIEKKKPAQQLFKPQIITRYEQYMNFTSYINISNNIRITSEELETPYVLYVGKGNNGSLIKNIFKTYRPWWSIQEADPSNKQINLHWYQLRQNNILEMFKQYNNTQIEFDKLQYFVQMTESEDKTQDKSQPQSRSEIRSSNQRSQSLISKDTSIMARRLDPQLDKRSSSRSKITNKSTDKISKLSPVVKNYNIKELKEQQLQTQMNATHKKALTNPKMWPIYLLYRKIFSASDMRKIKKLGIIKQDGKIDGKLIRSKMKTIQNRSINIKMHNHLQSNFHLSNKKALFVNIRNYFQAKKINPFDYIPMTFHVQKIGDKQYDSFVQQYHKRCEQIAQDEKNNKKSQYKGAFKPKKRNAWLVKPGENTNRGNGIEVVESLDEIKQIIMKDNIDAQGRPRTHIIQQYIMPFLYQKRKFDIRCYILMTSVNGIQKGYWFQDGYIRTACKQFNMKNLSNRMIHLTNDAVQKKCEDYGKYEPGNKLSFSDFQRYLDTNYNNVQSGPKLKFWQQAYPQMKKLATQAIRSVYTKINPTKKQFSFEIFGLDFLIDENFKVWLIQANTNPCLQLSSPLLGRIIPTMIQNAFKIAVDPVFPPPSLAEIAKLTKKIVLPQNPTENNKFELVFDECEEGPQLKSLLTSIPNVQIYNIEEEEEQYEDEQKDKENYFD